MARSYCLSRQLNKRYGELENYASKKSGAAYDERSLQGTPDSQFEGDGYSMCRLPDDIVVGPVVQPPCVKATQLRPDSRYMRTRHDI